LAGLAGDLGLAEGGDAETAPPRPPRGGCRRSDAFIAARGAALTIAPRPGRARTDGLACGSLAVAATAGGGDSGVSLPMRGEGTTGVTTGSFSGATGAISGGLVPSTSGGRWCGGFTPFPDSDHNTSAAPTTKPVKPTLAMA
jgi:hypothetical protein